MTETTFLSDEHTSSNPKYPDVEVALVGEDGNAFNLIGLVSKALRRAKYPREEIDEFAKMAMSCESYDELLQNIMRTVNVT